MRRPGFALCAVLFAGWGCGGDDLVLPEEPLGGLEIMDGNAQEGSPGVPLPERLLVRLTDQEGAGIPDRAVVWSVTSGGGTINPATDVTDAEGFANAQWTLGPAEGVQRASAQVPDIGAVTFTATNAEIRVLDQDDQPVEGYPVTFVITSGGGNVSGESQTTDGEGVARVGAWTLGAEPGSNTLEARAGSLAGSPVVFTAEGTEPEPEPEPEVDRLVYRTPPRDVEVGERFRVEVALVDARGDVVPLSEIFIYLGLFREGQDNPTNDLLSGERFENTDGGIAVFDLSVEQPGRYRLRALTDDLPELGPHGPQPYLFSEVFEVE
jgi:hypothetical protein